MANTKSAKKAVRSSEKKKIHNLNWKKRVKTAIKNLQNLIKKGTTGEDLTKSLSVAQKVIDKASKENVMHKNKANRMKSKLSQKIVKSSDAKPTAKKSKSK